MFAHVNASLFGLPTIRSSRAQDLVKKEFDGHQDVHTSAYFLTIATSTAFGFWLDVVTIAFVAFLTYSFIFLNDGIIPTNTCSNSIINYIHLIIIRVL